MRRADFGKTAVPANSTTEGAIYNEPEVYASVPPDLTGTTGKQHKAGQKIRQRALNRYETARSGGHRDLANTHAPLVGKKAYKKSGSEPKPVAHDAGAKQL